MKTKKAFTLVELLVIIAIIGILAAMVAGVVNKRRQGVAKKVQTSVPQTGKGYDVQMLFMIDGMKVYRFTDGGRYIYVVDGRNSKTVWNESTQVGKVSYDTPVQVETVK